MIILECANILGSCALKYPRATCRPRVNRISFLPCDNAGWGVIAPRCVYIDGISMASKKFVIVARSRHLIYRVLSDENKKRSNINLLPSGHAADYIIRASSRTFGSPIRSSNRGERRCHNPHVQHHLVASIYLPIFPRDAWHRLLIRPDTDKKWNLIYTCNNFSVKVLQGNDKRL